MAPNSPSEGATPPRTPRQTFGAPRRSAALLWSVRAAPEIAPGLDVVHFPHDLRRTGAGRNPGTRATAAHRARGHHRRARARARGADPVHAPHPAVAELVDGRLCGSRDRHASRRDAEGD